MSLLVGSSNTTTSCKCATACRACSGFAEVRGKRRTTRSSGSSSCRSGTMLNGSGCAPDFDPNPRESDPNVHRSCVPDGSYFTEMPYLWALSSDGTARFLADASSCAPDQGVTMNKTEFVGHVAKRAEAT